MLESLSVLRSSISMWQTGVYCFHCYCVIRKHLCLKRFNWIEFVFAASWNMMCAARYFLGKWPYIWIAGNWWWQTNKQPSNEYKHHIFNGFYAKTILFSVISAKKICFVFTSKAEPQHKYPQLCNASWRCSACACSFSQAEDAVLLDWYWNVSYVLFIFGLRWSR